MLKLLAILTMVIDHVGAVFFPEHEWMRAIGRLTMPIFAYAIARGFFFTHSRKDYSIRLAALAVISQLPFTVLFSEHYATVNLGLLIPIVTLNMIVPWVLAILLLMAPVWVTPLAIPVFLMIPMDYTGLVVLLPVAIYHFWFKKKSYWLAGLSATLLLSIIALISSPIQWWALIAILVIVLLERWDHKIKINKWFFYSFYPAHMAVIWLLSFVF